MRNICLRCTYLFIFLSIIPFLFGCTGGGSDDPLKPEGDKIEKPGGGTDNNKPESAYINLSTSDSVYVDNGSSVFDLVFSTNKDWSISVNHPWCSPASYSGSAGSQRIVVNIAKNDADQDRVAEVMIKAESVIRKVYVVQEKQYVLSVENKEFNVSYKGDSLKIRAMCNMDVEASYSVSWMELSQRKTGLGYADFTFYVYPNMQKEERRAEIKFVGNMENLEVVVTVIQSVEPVEEDGPGGNIGDMGWN